MEYSDAVFDLIDYVIRLDPGEIVESVTAFCQTVDIPAPVSAASVPSADVRSGATPFGKRFVSKRTKVN